MGILVDRAALVVADEGGGGGEGDMDESGEVLVDVDDDEVLSGFESELESVVVSSLLLFGVVDDCGSVAEDVSPSALSSLLLVEPSDVNLEEDGSPIEAGRNVPGSIWLPTVASRTPHRAPLDRPIMGMADTPVKKKKKQ